MTSDPGWQRPEDGRPANARLVDPEDDLAAVPAAGGADFAAGGADFETTRIPPMNSGAGPAPSTAYGMIGDPEPLPYVQPPADIVPPVPSAPPVGPAPQTPGPAHIGAPDAELKAAGRRGTQDLGLLLLRLTLGVVFIAHGLQKAFGWWGGSGLDGFQDTLSEAGYQHAGVLTYLGAGAQIAAGVLLVLGLFTPLAAAGALAFLVNALLAAFTAQREDGVLTVFGPESEYLIVLAMLAAGIVLAGPGRYGFDAGRGWARRPFIGSFLALLLAVAGGVAAWFFLHGTNPFA